MEAIEPNWHALMVFAGAWAICCFGLFYLSGALPLWAAPQALRQKAGPSLVIANVALLVILTVCTVLFGFSELRITSLIVTSGFIFLFTPQLVQKLPAFLKDTQLGHVGLACLGMASVALLYSFSSFTQTSVLATG